MQYVHMWECRWGLGDSWNVGLINAFCWFFLHGIRQLPPRHPRHNYKKVRVCHGKVNTCDHWRQKIWLSLNQPFEWSTVAMEQLEKYNFGSKEANGTILKKTTDNVTQSKICNQCDFASSQEGDFIRHLKTHGGEKSNKCSQWLYICTSSQSWQPYEAGQWRKALQMWPVWVCICASTGNLKKQIRKHIVSN